VIKDEINGNGIVEKKINDFIVLKLENRHTQIYINGERFIQCTKLVLNIPMGIDHEQLSEINSIDEAEDYLKEPKVHSMGSYDITPEQEFWGHCSNLEAWVEHDYDTRILHSNIAFPMLKKLSEVGDKKALHAFREEIYLRLQEGPINTLLFLIKEGYHVFLDDEQLSALFHEKQFLKVLNRALQEYHEITIIPFLSYCIEIGIEGVESQFLPLIRNVDIQIVLNALDYLNSNNFDSWEFDQFILKIAPDFLETIGDRFLDDMNSGIHENVILRSLEMFKMMCSKIVRRELRWFNLEICNSMIREYYQKKEIKVNYNLTDNKIAYFLEFSASHGWYFDLTQDNKLLLHQRLGQILYPHEAVIITKTYLHNDSIGTDLLVLDSQNPSLTELLNKIETSRELFIEDISEFVENVGEIIFNEELSIVERYFLIFKFLTALYENFYERKTILFDNEDFKTKLIAFYRARNFDVEFKLRGSEILIYKIKQFGASYYYNLLADTISHDDIHFPPILACKELAKIFLDSTTIIQRVQALKQGIKFSLQTYKNMAEDVMNSI